MTLGGLIEVNAFESDENFELSWGKGENKFPNKKSDTKSRNLWTNLPTLCRCESYVYVNTSSSVVWSSITNLVMVGVLIYGTTK
jgi:hypothetical protein